MNQWTPKRFWSQTKVAPLADGFGVMLDDRMVRTPSQQPLSLPTAALAEAVAAEWDAQAEVIDQHSMPMTRSANSALDKVAPQFAAVADMLVAYGETDLLCHRAADPEELSQQQAEAWDPLLDWSNSALGAPLRPVFGIMAETQPKISLQRLHAQVHGQDLFALTALHDLVALSGSLIIGLAAQQDVLPIEELWRRSRIDETWQQSQWGVDETAAAAAAAKRRDFLHAATFHRLSRV